MKVFDFQVEETKRRALESALATVLYDWTQLRPLLPWRTGNDMVTVYETNLYEQKGWIGAADYRTGTIYLEQDLTPGDAALTFLHEAAHMVDAFALSTKQREELARVMTDSPNDLDVLGKTGWFDEKGTEYFSQLGENFPGWFVRAFTDITPDERGYTIRSNPERAKRVRSALRGMTGAFLSP